MPATAAKSSSTLNRTRFGWFFTFVVAVVEDDTTVASSVISSRTTGSLAVTSPRRSYSASIRLAATPPMWSFKDNSFSLISFLT